jgi:AraC-like DNA-binding protein
MHSGYQWTLPEQAAVAMTNLIAVALALALSRIPLLFKPPVAWYREKYGKRTSSTSLNSAGGGVLPGSGHTTPTNGGVAGIPLAHIANSHTGNSHNGNDESLLALDSVESGISNAIRVMFRGRIRVGVVESDNAVTKLCRRVMINAREDTLRFSLALLFAICLVGLFVMEQTLAILSANIVTGSDVLSTHSDCGSWRLNDTAYAANGSYNGPSSWVEFSTLQAKELRARNYAEKCYGVRDEIEACNMFSTPTVQFETKFNVPCPFAEGMCLMGPSSAVAMDTGYQPLSTLGFNLPISSSFRRRTVCTPLNTDDYVATGHNNESPDSIFWAYLYGWPVQQKHRHQIPVLYTHALHTPAMDTKGYHLL